MASEPESEGKSDEAYLQAFKARRSPNDDPSSAMAPPTPAEADVLAMPGLVTWAVVGDVLDQAKPASGVATAIEGHGRILYRISPTLDSSSASPKQRLYKKLADVPAEASIDAVNLCAHHRIGLATLAEMQARGIKCCVLQPGADHEDVVRKAAELGIAYQRTCMIVNPLCALTEDERRRAEATTGAGAGCGCVVS